MLSNLFTTVASLAVLQLASPMPTAPRPGATAATATAISATSESRRLEGHRLEDRGTGDEHLDLARRAMIKGEFEVAGREFASAAAREREAGRLPIVAVRGLVDALYAQSHHREAAITMEQFANEASLRGDNETEALALADAVWLDLECGQRSQAQMLTARLRVLMKETPLTGVTRRAIKARVG